jgi:enoyl-CoA hydratase
MTTANGQPVVVIERIELPQSSLQAIIVTINRPEKNNCFNTEVAHSLARLFADIADNTDEDVAAVIFTGNGSSFCAGADLANPPNALNQSSDLAEDLALNPVHQMSRIQVPIIGAVRGHVITGGFELALACDILVGDWTTRFRDTHVKFGLAPCWGLSQKLQRRIGPGRARLTSYAARPIGAKQAYDWGLLDDFVQESDRESCMQRAVAIADAIGSQDGKMVQRYKMALEQGGATSLEKGLQRERQLAFAHYYKLMGDESTFENAKSFIIDEKRPRLQSKL